jgi:hypothetical protein
MNYDQETILDGSPPAPTSASLVAAATTPSSSTAITVHEPPLPCRCPPSPMSHALVLSRPWVTGRRYLLYRRPRPYRLRSSPSDLSSPAPDLSRPLAPGIGPPLVVVMRAMSVPRHPVATQSRIRPTRCHVRPLPP